MKVLHHLFFILAISLTTACTSEALKADEVLANLPHHVGKRVTIQTRFRSGARCRIGDKGEWKTYCKGNCQYCRGPLVVDALMPQENGALADWPMILGGTWKGRDIRCKGPLNEVKCYPFELGKMYVVRGILENQSPPKLIVNDWWEPQD